jgi:hypothetical protein
MVTDDLDDRLRRAAEPEPEAVDRVVRVALASADAGRPGSAVVPVREWHGAFATLAACLIATVTFGVWWCARQASPAPAGVYRAEASRSVITSRVVAVTADDGTTLILSTTPGDEWLPPGSRIVVGGGEAR